jgi:hypothetical protein
MNPNTTTITIGLSERHDTGWWESEMGTTVARYATADKKGDTPACVLRAIADEMEQNERQRDPGATAPEVVVAGPAEYISYVDRVFQHLEHELIAGGYDLGDIAADITANPELYRMYALLAMTTGTATTSEQVHDAGSLWRYPTMPEHRSIVPFDQLSPMVQGYDDAFRDAIRKVAADLPRLKP